MDKLEAIEDDNKRVYAVGNLAKPIMAAMLVMCRNTVRVQTAKETLWLGCIVVLNALGVLKNSVVA